VELQRRTARELKASGAKFKLLAAEQQRAKRRGEAATDIEATVEKRASAGCNSNSLGKCKGEGKGGKGNGKGRS
jgi:hypothetical protein